jgi:beta-N-acetylglucosaminidase
MSIKPLINSTHKTLTYSANQNSSTAVVVSTTIPNVEEDAIVQQEIAEQARIQLTLEEEIASQIAEEEEQERLRQLEIARQERIDYINSIVCDTSDISRVTGLNDIEDYKLLTEGTWWEGYEQTLMNLEQTYGINAIFAMSVSTIESGSGTSVRASSRHNYYGIEISNKSWADLGDNTLWWGGMLNRVYVEKDLLSVWDIGPVYCPPNREWEEMVSTQMNYLYNSLINKLMDTVE